MPTEVINVWMSTVSAIPEALWPRIVDILDRTERECAGRFFAERHRREYQAAHALKRLMLTAAVGGAVAPSAWTFEVTAYGKPRVASGRGPYFNLSHSDGLVACAVSPLIEIGLDVETLDRAAPLDIARMWFAPSEDRWLQGQPAAARQMGFFRLWTLKEAYIKATGLGLSQSLDTFAFSFDPVRVMFADPALGDPDAWRFEQCPVGGHHMLAVAWRAISRELSVEVVAVQLDVLLGQQGGASRSAGKADWFA